MVENKIKIKSIKNKSGFKILDISGEPGAFIDNHKTSHEAIILIKSGSILYKDDNNLVPLSPGDTYDIPTNVFHKVICTTNAKFFVVMSIKSEISFQK